MIKSYTNDLVISPQPEAIPWFQSVWPHQQNDKLLAASGFTNKVRTGFCLKSAFMRGCLQTKGTSVSLIPHYNDVIMSTMASQITSISIVYSTVCSSADQRKYQSSASLAFVRGIHRWPVNSPPKGPVTRKMFPFDDVIMYQLSCMHADRSVDLGEIELL